MTVAASLKFYVQIFTYWPKYIIIARHDKNHETSYESFVLEIVWLKRILLNATLGCCCGCCFCYCSGVTNLPNNLIFRFVGVYLYRSLWNCTSIVTDSSSRTNISSSSTCLFYVVVLFLYNNDNSFRFVLPSSFCKTFALLLIYLIHYLPKFMSVLA